MASYLYRLGRWSCRKRRWVALSWLAIFAAVILGNVALSKPTSDAFELPSIESTNAFELIKERAPDSSPDGVSALLVFSAPAGHTLTEPDLRIAVHAALGSAKTSDVASISDPFVDGIVSDDKTVAYGTVQYAVAAVDLTAADRAALDDAREVATAAGLDISVGGEAADEESGPPLTELLGLAVALVVVTITFGSLVAAGMPLLIAIVSVGIGIMAIGTLSGFVELGATTPALGSMLGLAVGIDYALFIMSRYRHESRDGRSTEEAVGRAVGTAGSAVVFAGLTVVIALAGLAVCGIPFLTQLGLAGAGMVALAVLVALTLLPAVLGFAGPRIMGGRLWFLAQRDPEGSETDADVVRTLGRGWVELVSRFRVAALIGGVLTAAVLAIPVLSMQTALPDASVDPRGSGTRTAYDTIAREFGPGFNGPLVVVVDTADADDPLAAVNTAVKELQGIGDGVLDVVPPAVAGDTAIEEALSQQLDAVRFATITVVPDSGPTAPATKQLVDTIRTRLGGLPTDTGARALVTGQTAVGVDIAEALARVFPLYLAVVIGLAFLLLILVFRSIWIPLKAALGFLLSVGASLGATVAVFQWGWFQGLLGLDTPAPVLFLLPLLLTGILFGLAMDYEVFLVTRMREAHLHGAPARRAVIVGFTHSARVVTAAALIMIGVFAGFALADDATLKSIGFALAFGVLVDAFLVRMLIVPAVMFIAGESIWWLPRWLDRLLPEVDVEGEKLSAAAVNP